MEYFLLTMRTYTDTVQKQVKSERVAKIILRSTVNGDAFFVNFPYKYLESERFVN